MTLVLIGKGLVLGGLTFKNRGHLGSRILDPDNYLTHTIHRVFVSCFFVCLYKHSIHLFFHHLLPALEVFLLADEMVEGRERHVSGFMWPRDIKTIGWFRKSGNWYSNQRLVAFG